MTLKSLKGLEKVKDYIEEIDLNLTKIRDTSIFKEYDFPILKIINADDATFNMDE